MAGNHLYQLGLIYRGDAIIDGSTDLRLLSSKTSRMFRIKSLLIGLTAVGKELKGSRLEHPAQVLNRGNFHAYDFVGHSVLEYGLSAPELC